MSEFTNVNNELIHIEQELQVKTNSINHAREAYLYAKADYENTFSRYLLETKVNKPEMTQSEIKAMATNLSYEKKLNLITKESSYKALSNEIRSLRDRIDVLREVSFNLRKEASF